MGVHQPPKRGLVKLLWRGRETEGRGRQSALTEEEERSRERPMPGLLGKSFKERVMPAMS